VTERDVMLAAVALSRATKVEWCADDVVVVTLTTKKRTMVEHPITLDILEELEKRQYIVLSDEPEPTGSIVIKPRCKYQSDWYLSLNRLTFL
jgi:hypothetical protein